MLQAYHYLERWVSPEWEVYQAALPSAALLQLPGREFPGLDQLGSIAIYDTNKCNGCNVKRHQSLLHRSNMSFKAFGISDKSKKNSKVLKSAALAEFAEPTYEKSELAELPDSPTERERESDAFQVGVKGVHLALHFKYLVAMLKPPSLLPAQSMIMIGLQNELAIPHYALWSLKSRNWRWWAWVQHHALS